MNLAPLLAYDFAKRVFDVLVAGVLLVALSPLLLAVAALVVTFHGRPVLFTQLRPGLHGRLFTLYKFRSMRPVDESRGRLEDEHRLTRFGHVLRSTSLDELPSLWNVLRGDMSLVGPRPLLVEYLPLYSPVQARRHEVRPGITGLAQVSGRNAITWDEKFAKDVDYVDSRSWAVDLGILVATARSVVRRDGISHEGHVTMARFEGNHD